MVRAALCITVLAALALADTAAAHDPAVQPGGSRLMALFGQRDLAPADDHGTRAPVARRAQLTAPPATPRATCGPGSRPEPGIQGRVPAGASKDGYACNARLLGREGRAGGFKVRRFVDRAGRECAYYDTTLLFPTNVLSLSDQPTGLAVLDMSDPERPVRTETLVTPAMQSPHESVVLNEKRGLLAAVLGNPGTAPGILDLYDIGTDCRHPELLSSSPAGILGHESGFAPDGRTFYATSLGTGQVTAVDVTNPRAPVPLWVGDYPSHGMSLSEDGNRAYLAALGQGLVILDVSEINARKPNPQVREISRLTWPTMSIPQNAIPVTIRGRPYIVEIDEFSVQEEGGSFPAANGPRVGAGRIIDISDERRPRVVSDLRLEVNQPERRAELADDPSAQSVVQGYAGHYCDVPSRVDPGIVACSFIASGLRVFDIRDPRAPKEIAYFVAPPTAGSTSGEPSNFAMSAPAFAPDRGEVWYSDGNSGFYALQLQNGVWPAADAGGGSLLGARRTCTSRRSFVIRIRAPRGQRLRRPRVRISAGRVRRVVRRGRVWRATIDLRGVPRRAVTVRVVARTTRGRSLRQSRRYRTCVPRRT
jgi:hypothetical protein